MAAKGQPVSAIRKDNIVYIISCEKETYIFIPKTGQLDPDNHTGLALSTSNNTIEGF